MSSFYNQEELQAIGFSSLGDNVLISRKASIYGAEKMHIGNHVRIDDFAILSGQVTLGNYVHIAAGCKLYGGISGIEIKSFSGCSANCTIYAQIDDFSGEYMLHPTIPDIYRNVVNGAVVLESHAVVGAHSVVLPAVIVGEGVAVGAQSLVNKSLDAWGVYAGSPARFIKERSKELLQHHARFMADTSS